jgi:hypothetical protein
LHAAGGGSLLSVMLFLGLAACQTLEEGVASPTLATSWDRVPRPRLNDGAARSAGPANANFADRPRSEALYLEEGTGRFVGDPPCADAPFPAHPALTM